MELHKLVVLIGQSLAQGHGIAIPGTSVCRRTRKVGPAIAARGQHGVFGTDTMQGTVLHVQGNDSHAGLSVVTHQQVQTKVFDKVGRIKGQ